MQLNKKTLDTKPIIYSRRHSEPIYCVWTHVMPAHYQHDNKFREFHCYGRKVGRI